MLNQSSSELDCDVSQCKPCKSTGVNHNFLNHVLLCFQYNLTARAVLEADDSVEILVELLQIYREKSAIFCNACLLLGILGHDSEQRVVSSAISTQE